MLFYGFLLIFMQKTCQTFRIVIYARIVLKEFRTKLTLSVKCVCCAEPFEHDTNLDRGKPSKLFDLGVFSLASVNSQSVLFLLRSLGTTLV